MDETVTVLAEGITIYEILQAGLILYFTHAHYYRRVFSLIWTNTGNDLPQVIYFSPVLFSIPTVYPSRCEIAIPRVLSIFGVKEILEVVESYGLSVIHIGSAVSKIGKESRNVKKDRKFAP